MSRDPLWFVMFAHCNPLRTNPDYFVCVKNKNLSVCYFVCAFHADPSPWFWPPAKDILHGTKDYLHLLFLFDLVLLIHLISLKPTEFTFTDQQDFQRFVLNGFWLKIIRESWTVVQRFLLQWKKLLPYFRNGPWSLIAFGHFVSSLFFLLNLV